LVVPEVSRRTVLGSAAVGAGALVLAGCGGGSGGSGDAGKGSAGATVAPAATASPGPLVALAQVPVGGSVATTVGGRPVLVSQKSAGVVAAFSAICTHMGCTVNPAGAELHCPCHGSKYDAFTGAVIAGPAPGPLTSIAVTVQGDTITTT
jgi:Rieske Fe-S protein